MLEIKDKEELKALVNEILAEPVTVEIINKSDNPSPKPATDGSAGVDLRAHLPEGLNSITIPPHSKLAVPTGLFIKLPEGFEAQVRSRSGLARKHGIFVLNSPGTIDSDYRGEIVVILYNISVASFTVEEGDRIAQLVVTRHSKVFFDRVREFEEDSSERNSRGFGSTGMK